MSNRRKLLWAGAAILVLLFLVAISIPNLLRSRIAANEATLVGKSRSAQMPDHQDVMQLQAALYAPVPSPDKKLIHNAELGLIVGDVRAAAEQIRKLTELNHGEIDKLEIMETSGGPLSATLVVRVPASGLENALAEIKKVAVRTEREQVSTRDVTREFYDNEAHMHNLRAEEQQYLAIMKQAHTVKDTLEVAEKLSDVRDRIERLQAQVQLMTHDIEMSAVTVALMQESDTRVFGIRWRPLHNARVAARELLMGLGEWLDWVVAILIKLPLILLWAVTAGGILWVLWKIGRSVWRRLNPKVAQAQ
ncbi:MAG: DUF4349 domain-containing protein [Terriglobales bacterium]